MKSDVQESAWMKYDKIFIDRKSANLHVHTLKAVLLRPWKLMPINIHETTIAL